MITMDVVDQEKEETDATAPATALENAVVGDSQSAIDAIPNAIEEVEIIEDSMVYEDQDESRPQDPTNSKEVALKWRCSGKH